MICELKRLEGNFHYFLFTIKAIRTCLAFHSGAGESLGSQNKFKGAVGGTLFCDDSPLSPAAD